MAATANRGRRSVSSDQPAVRVLDRRLDERLVRLPSKIADYMTSDSEDEAEYCGQGERPFQAFDWRLVEERGDRQQGSD